MILLAWWAFIISMILCWILYEYINKNSGERKWGDGITGLKL